ncbi:ABC transporter substrate-binding protein [Oscillospiraceae bacterium LTW-04]|nr:ABC transporter substrate-binding protein [Oscillospiraceae bacterium MB24-C1]
MKSLNTIRKNMAAILVLMCCAALTACTTPIQSTQPAQGSTTGNTSAIQFTDDDGREIKLDAPCSRIISLYSAHTENLYEIGAGEKLIGVYTSSIYPPEVTFLPTYDYKGDPEQIIAAQPDLVLILPLISRKAPDYIAQIERAGIPVVSLYPDDYDEFADYIGKLAALTGTEETAQQRLVDFYGAIGDVVAITEQVTDKKTVFMESTENELRTVTPYSMPGRAIVFSGGINLAVDAQPVAKGSAFASFGIEKVLENADNIDVYVSQRGAMNTGGNLMSISERDGFDTIKAIKENRVYLIADKIINSPTFRFQKGVAEMARFLYPDLMDGLSAYENDDAATRLGCAEIVLKALHLPIYTPPSSKYYETEQKGHTYGFFEDVHWNDVGFDAVETAVHGGYIDWEKASDGLEYFYPDRLVTREELAKTVFLVGNFSPTANTEVDDIDACEKPRIVQTLVDRGIFLLEDGNFNPKRTVTNNEILTALKATLANSVV